MTHADLLKYLLPPTSVDSGGAAIGAEITAEGNALDGALTSAVTLLLESDPRTTSEMLTDWERVLGLPESCVTTRQSIDQRRTAAAVKIAAMGGQSRAYFIALAAALGVLVTITEYRPFTVGRTVGNPLSNGDWIWAWRVNAPLTNPVVPFLVGSSTAGQPLRYWGNKMLECTIRRYKPAHTIVLFSYR